MSRPDDVPEDVWEEAGLAMSPAWLNSETPAYFVQRVGIARALLAERERCAKICDEAEKQCLEGRNEHPIKSEMRILNQGAMTLARDLATAIRGEI